MSMLRKIQRVGKRATKFQYCSTYQSVVIECSTKEKWCPTQICVSWTRKGRRLITKLRPWQPSPDNKLRGVVIWPEPEIMEITVTLYKGPKDKSYESKEWEFAVIDVDANNKRKVLASASINMVKYASTMPFEHDLHLRLKPVSRKIKTVMLEVSLTSEFLKEGKATDDDMMSIASMMSVSNLSTIGFLEDEDDDEYYWTGGRSITPPSVPDHILSTDQLQKWAAGITASYPSIKITNMTTSWRNGMGFLAIIHYFRPDLIPDFDMLSPNSIKENNRMAFELAKNLGIACPLTPNMMVTTTIPDKLSVTSFVYQMHEYFTRATQSAVTRSGSRKKEGTKSPTGSQASPTSPFDISKFEMFAGNLSPVDPSPARTDRVLNVYSRHSRNSSQGSEFTHAGSEPSVSPIKGQESVAQVKEEEPGVDTSVDISDINMGTPAGTVYKVKHDSVTLHSTPKEDASQGPSLSPKTTAKLQLDELVGECLQSSNLPEPMAEVSNREEDREVEFENLVDTEDSSEPANTTSSCSLLDDDELRVPDLPVDGKMSTVSSSSSIGEQGSDKGSQSTTGKVNGKSMGRKLPSLPPDSQGEQVKAEERKRLAKEMLRKHKLDKIKIPSNISSVVNTKDQSKTKYRQQAIEMLSEAFGTPRSARRAAKGEGDDSLVSEGSATSLGTDDDASPIMIAKRDTSLTAPKNLHRATHSDTLIGQNKAKRLAPAVHETRIRANSVGPDLYRTKPTVNGGVGLKEERNTHSRRKSLGENVTSPDNKQDVQTYADPTATDLITSQSPSPTEPSHEDREGMEDTALQRRVRELSTSRRPRSASAAAGDSRLLGRSKLVDVEVRVHSATDENVQAVQDKVCDNRLRELGNKSRPRSATLTAIQQRTTSPEHSTSLSPPEHEKHSIQARKISEGNLETNMHLKQQRIKELGSQSRPRSASARALSNPPSGARQLRKPARPLPAARPVSAKPSQAAQRLAQQKKQQEEEVKAAAAAVEEARKNMTDGLDDEEQELVNGEQTHITSDDTKHPKPSIPADLSSQTPSGKGSGTPVHKKSLELESPSAWISDNSITKDILVTQSEYVREELVSLQTNLNTLEERASNIEADIRNAMSAGDKDEEELLMQEWFSLLNRKNELIKRQLELNLIEKEEDLEKRQFFLNRELRPLMEIPEEEKSQEQKDRESHLLSELLTLIDERDKLERRKMSAESTAFHERSGLAAAQAKSADIVHGTEQQSRQQGSRECVIS